MHMESALIATSVATVAAATQGGAIKHSLNKIKEDLCKNKIALMGISGALVFSAQMINFTIPGTGSSGHMVGGVLLAMLLGPHAAFLALSVLLGVQCLLFGDGGLLALGCNIFNMAFLSCYVAYPYIAKPIMKKFEGKKGIVIASILANVVGLFLGALSVTIETTLSGITELSFMKFAAVMIPIHIPISLIEGLVTAGILLYVYSANKDLIPSAMKGKSIKELNLIAVQRVMAFGAIITSGLLSLFASAFPDGLEWSILNLTGVESLEATGRIHTFFDNIQSVTTLLPDYTVQAIESAFGTSIAGVVGCVITGVLICAIAKTMAKISTEA